MTTKALAYGLGVVTLLSVTLSLLLLHGNGSSNPTPTPTPRFFGMQPPKKKLTFEEEGTTTEEPKPLDNQDADEQKNDNSSSSSNSYFDGPDQVLECFTNDTIHIVFAVDCGNLIGMLTMMRSILVTNHHTNITFHILLPQTVRCSSCSMDFLEKNRSCGICGVAHLQLLMETVVDHKCKVEIIRVDDKSLRGKIRIHSSFQHLKNIVNYYRFLLGDTLPHLEKVIYLDPDMVVLKPICNLWEIPLDGFTVAAVQFRNTRYCNIGESIETMLNFQDSEVSEKYDRNEPFFNAGVLVVDLVKWRELRITKRLLQILELNQERPLYWLGSQPPLNMVFYRNYKKLPIFWNFCPGSADSSTQFMSNELLKTRHKRRRKIKVEEFVRIASMQGIIHFTGNQKPWTDSRIVTSRFWNPFFSQVQSILAGRSFCSGSDLSRLQ